jgi:NDP-sugar pyrophosphorylase family protein
MGKINSDMIAMIFAAGLGTRFKPWTDLHPKALALVHNKPLLEHNIKYLQQYGVKKLVVNVHHFAEQVIDALSLNDGWGSEWQISDERDELLETGGGLVKAKPLFAQGHRFMTINADILTDIPLDEMLAYHEKENALITLAITERPSTRNLLFDENHRLCGWENRSTGEKIIKVENKNTKAMSYSCVAIFEPEVFNLMRQHGKFSLTETYLNLAHTGRIKGFNHTGGRFVDVGKPESVAVAEAMFPEIRD